MSKKHITIPVTDALSTFLGRVQNPTALQTIAALAKNPCDEGIRDFAAATIPYQAKEISDLQKVEKVAMEYWHGVCPDDLHPEDADLLGDLGVPTDNFIGHSVNGIAE